MVSAGNEYVCQDFDSGTRTFQIYLQLHNAARLASRSTPEYIYIILHETRAIFVSGSCFLPRTFAFIPRVAFPFCSFVSFSTSLVIRFNFLATSPALCTLPFDSFVMSEIAPRYSRRASGRRAFGVPRFISLFHFRLPFKLLCFRRQSFSRRTGCERARSSRA